MRGVVAEFAVLDGCLNGVVLLQQFPAKSFRPKRKNQVLVELAPAGASEGDLVTWLAVVWMFQRSGIDAPQNIVTP
jgi:hypothetical protein